MRIEEELRALMCKVHVELNNIDRYSYTSDYRANLSTRSKTTDKLTHYSEMIMFPVKSDESILD